MATDFRGWLLANDSTAKFPAGSLSYTGNDGRVDPTKIAQFNGWEGSPFLGLQTSDKGDLGVVGDAIAKAYKRYQSEFGNESDPYSGGGSSSPAYDPGDLAYLDDQESQLKRLLKSAGNTLDSGLTNLSDSYNKEVGGANARRSRTLEDFGIQREDDTRDKSSALGKVDTNARTLNDSLRRILGMASGSGSSAYKYAAPNAVARQASAQRTGVLGDYAENDRNITLSENRAKTDFESLLEDLANQRKQQESDLRGGVLEREQGINSDLANVAAERAKLLGGGYAETRLAQAPFREAINSRQSQLDSLFERFRSPTLTPKPVNVQTPNLRDYMVDRAGINANRQSQSQYSPYMNFLRPKQDEEEQLV